MAEVVSLSDAVERLFDDRFMRPIWPFTGDREATPALDLYTTPESVVARIALPGVKPEDVDVTVADDLVTVTGTFKEEKETAEPGYIHKELSRGAFHRSFMVPIPVKAEAAKASFKDGLLVLTLPKTEAGKPKHLKVEVA
jgi:HSP20 family protein